MNTPICDFVKKYSDSKAMRLHMPGHKGKNFFGFEKLDITEISGADSLYEAEGIIKESEENAGSVFECTTFYSTEGSSQCIRAMLYLITLYTKTNGKNPLILAGRNAHKTFLSAAALLDFNIEWINPKKDESYLSCKTDASEINRILSDSEQKPVAVYLTNPDYLGNCLDIKSIADVCHKHGVFLAVDNAHGAYLKFLPESAHPIDLGADICCDSAHKTLPVLTGGAYLHVSDNAPTFFCDNAKNALSLFGSTSPSYIILQSLDAANKYISDIYKDELVHFVAKISELKKDLILKGYSLIGNEPLKITFDIKKYGYTGYNFADILSENNISCEFADNDYVVMMFTPQIDNSDLEFLKNVLIDIPCQNEIFSSPPDFLPCKRIVSVREAVLSPYDKISVKDSVGRILAVSDVSCPPAVPVVISGELIDEHARDCFEYYGIKECKVLK